MAFERRDRSKSRRDGGAPGGSPAAAASAAARAGSDDGTQRMPGPERGAAPMALEPLERLGPQRCRFGFTVAGARAPAGAEV